MGMDEDVATTVLSVFTGLVIGTVAESVMPTAPTKHVLKNDIPRLHHAAIVAYT